MKKETFEQFLQDKHYEIYPMILDDDLPDHFDNWLTELQVDDFLILGQEYGELKNIEGSEQCRKELQTYSKN